MKLWTQVLLCIVVLGFSQATCAQEKAVEVLDHCALIAAPDEYDGKRITVFAVYSYGLERDELFCPECRILGRITEVVFSDDHEKQLRKQLRKAPKHIGVIAGRFTGVFRKRPDTYGGYGSELNLEEVSHVRVLVRDYKTPLSSVPSCCELLERPKKQ